ncbi:MAG: NAD-dependent epimerase/dehydratase family protein [Geminicoccaceae bacterium]
MIGIVGGSGFIGTVLARTLLAEGRQVRLIDRAPSRAYPDHWRPADVRDARALSAAVAGCTTLYHLAAAHRDDVRPATLYHEVNVRGAEHLCAAAEAQRIERILFVSSVAVYGAADHELDEAAPLRPYSDYGRSKLAAEQVFRRWAARAPGRSLTIIRPTVVFGPGNRGNLFELIAQIARGRTVVIGDGCNRKSLAYVENLADFLVHALRFGPGSHVYNYADKPDPDMNGLVTVAVQALGLERGRPLHLPYGLGLGIGLGCDLLARITAHRLAVSAARIRKYAATTRFANARCLATGFRPRHDLHDALVTTIRREFAARAVSGRRLAFFAAKAGERQVT